MTTKTEQVRAQPRRAAASGVRARPRTAGRPAGEAATPYHHGALRDALLEAAERVLERDGLAGLTLRAVAREAGVSHAAPTHHFKDLTGLVSELAAIGFTRFNVAMKAAGEQPGTPIERAMARAHAYVAYAQANPGMYGLMFRTERLDYSRPSLHDAAEASFAGLAGSVAARSEGQAGGEQLSIDQAAAIARAWSLVHGYTMLLLDGRLTDILRRSPAGTTADSLLDAMLRATVPKLPPGA
ncbi:TetR/AcrR family transcriptional regulator [Bradyrhizobium sp. SRS-191]|uniref:TetR/AcrR family transcriptional regulator n=1 Tax=Bradyrhizobium sp. SRS-191 TaxID=2962606 RepID=UPI00211F0EED|nr:WHG domain-containing protein [Bradyrhizobium sp. SRS-191]